MAPPLLAPPPAIDPALIEAVERGQHTDLPPLISAPPEQQPYVSPNAPEAPETSGTPTTTGVP